MRHTTRVEMGAQSHTYADLIDLLDYMHVLVAALQRTGL